MQHPDRLSPKCKPWKEPARKKQSEKEGTTRATWLAYSEAFERRYQTKPLRSAAVNGQLARFIDAVGAEDAPKLAEFYLTTQDRYYAEQMHPVSLMLRDAPKLHAMWSTGRTSPAQHGRQSFDRMDYRAGVPADRSPS